MTNPPDHLNENALVQLVGERAAPDGSRAIDNFRAWFGRGTLVDADGAPRVFFHGTDRSFDTFRQAGASFFGRGIYLSDSAEAAADYGEEMGDSVVVMPVFVKMDNPYVFNAPPAMEEGTNITLVKALFEGDKLKEVLREMGPFGDLTTQLQTRLKRMGHDGLLVQMVDEPLEVIAFNANQVKSALGNSGAFDPTSSSLTDPAPRMRAKQALDFVNGLDEAPAAGPHP